MTETKNRLVLCVEDDEASRDLITFWWNMQGCQAVAVGTYEDATRLSRSAWDLFVIDKKLPDADGCDLCREVRELHPSAPIILTSADCREAVNAEAIRAGATLFVEKPIDLAAFGEVLKRLAGYQQTGPTGQEGKRPPEASL